jgi:hypothetical protein
MDSGATIHIPSFKKADLAIQKLMGDGQTDRMVKGKVFPSTGLGGP